MSTDAYALAASGMAAQQIQMDLIAANLANVSTTHTQSGGPYRARTAVLQTASSFADALESAQNADRDGLVWATFDDDALTQPEAVEVAAIVEQPGNLQTPGASGVDPIEQMVALVAAGRSYDANVSVLQAAKQMDLEASDITRLA